MELRLWWILDQLWRFIRDQTHITKIKEAEFIENKLKGQFFSKIAHEFKTPINSILGLVKQFNFTFDSEFDFEKSKQILKQIENLSNYIVYLINDVIEYSNINDQNYNNLSFNQNKIVYKNEKNYKKHFTDINLHITDINLNQITKFCINICETLLINKDKEKQIKLINENDLLMDNLIIPKKYHLNDLAVVDYLNLIFELNY